MLWEDYQRLRLPVPQERPERREPQVRPDLPALPERRRCLLRKPEHPDFPATSLLGPMGMAFDVKNMFDSKKAAKKQARNSFLLQYANMQRKKNILEQQLATRHARMANMGISSSASADAANNRLIDEAFDEIENDNMAFLAEQDAKADGFNLKYRKNLLDTGLAAAGKVLK